MRAADTHEMPTTAIPPLTILLDPSDAPHITAEALAAHAPAHGTVTVHPTAGVTDVVVLAHDLLVALGKQAIPLNLQHLSTSPSAWAAAATWMIIGNVQTLIMLRAHLMGAQRWKRLLWLREQTSVRLVLIHHTDAVPDVTLRWVENIDYRISRAWHECLPARASDAEERPGRNTRDSAPASDEPLAPFPVTLATPFPRYRADAYRRLTAAEFARVDAEYRRGREAACTWIAGRSLSWSQRPDPNPSVSILAERSFALWREGTLVDNVLGRVELPPVAGDIIGRDGRYPHPWADSLQLRAFLSQLVLGSPTPGHCIARVRGAQAGFLLHGLLLQPPVDLVAAGGPGLSYPFTHDVAERIRSQLAHPYITAALTIALVSGCSELQISDIDARSLGGSASQLTVFSSYYGLPDYCRDLVRAAALYCRLTPGGSRRLKGAVGEDGGALVSAAAACGIEWDPPQSYSRPWHVETGCWHVGKPLHDQHGAPGGTAVPDQEGQL